jgi:regulator of protease activity HflC (stomatin/prohibitin superfamily)
MFKKKQVESRPASNGWTDEAAPNTEVVSRAGIGLFKLVLFALVVAAVLAIFWFATGNIDVVALVAAVLIALLAIATVQIAQQWERVVVLRMGRFARVAGPGPFCVVPILETCALRVDERIRTTSFGAEETLTADLVPMDVDVVLYWMVWDAKLACTEIANFNQAVSFAAQTALRDAIGRGSAAEVAIRRNQLDRELREALEEKVAPWGITILSVEIRDILMPRDLQDVMSLEAQAEQRRKARITLMEAEQDITEMLATMDNTYAAHDHALRLRMMHLLYESVRETGGTVVIPSSFSEGYKDLPPETFVK